MTASTRLHDEDRQAIYAEAREYETARAFVDNLSVATLRLLLPGIETRIAGAAATARPDTAEADHAVETVAPVDANPPDDPAAAVAPALHETTAPATVVTIAIDLDVPLTEAKKRAVAVFEGTYVSLAVAATKGNLTHAARRAGVDRSNFKRVMELRALRTKGSMTLRSRKIADAAKHTDRIVEILAQNPGGRRTHEIAKAIDQPNGNAHNLLKCLQDQDRVERHGDKYAPIWTLPGGTPDPRIETIPAAAVAVISKAVGPIDSRRLRNEMSALLAAADKPVSAQALRRGIARLLGAGVIELSGANEHGAMYVLAKPEPEPEDSQLN